jgi:hypothetical protein
MGYFPWVGRVDYLPRVPDGMAGWPALLGGIVAVINNCQQCRKQHSWVAAHGFSRFGRVGVRVGARKFKFGYI